MKKRKGLFTVLVAAAVLAAACAGNQNETDAGQNETPAAVVTLKAGLIDPPGHIDVRAIEKVAEVVKEKSNGTLIIEVYPAAQLGKAADMIQGMQVGTVEMFVGATTWFGALETDFWLSGSLYLFNDQQHARDMHNSSYFQALAETLREKHGIRVLTQDWDRGPRNIISAKPVETIDDLQGLKVRVPPQESWVTSFELAGTNPTPLALTETFTGLQQGVIEATEQASNWLYFNKYHTIARNLTISNHNYEETGLFIADSVYSQLSPEQQSILNEAIAGVTEWHNGEVLKEIEESEEKMREEGINVIEIDIPAWKTHFRENFSQVVGQVGYSQDLVESISSTWE